MTQAKMPEQMWRELFRDQHERLTEVAEMLLCQNDSSELILETALAQLEGSPFYESFAKASAVRAVAKAAIAFDYCNFDLQSAIVDSESGRDEQLAPLPLEVLPWAERAAYFLREVLHYSRRDSALLLGVSDRTVEQLDRFARMRIKVPADNPVNSYSSGPKSAGREGPRQ